MARRRFRERFGRLALALFFAVSMNAEMVADMDLTDGNFAEEAILEAKALGAVGLAVVIPASVASRRREEGEEDSEESTDNDLIKYSKIIIAGFVAWVLTQTVVSGGNLPLPVVGKAALIACATAILIAGYLMIYKTWIGFLNRFNSVPPSVHTGGGTNKPHTKQQIKTTAAKQAGNDLRVISVLLPKLYRTGSLQPLGNDTRLVA